MKKFKLVLSIFMAGVFASAANAVSYKTELLYNNSQPQVQQPVVEVEHKNIQKDEKSLDLSSGFMQGSIFGSSCGASCARKKSGGGMFGGSCTRCTKNGAMFYNGPCKRCSKDGSMMPGGPCKHCNKESAMFGGPCKNCPKAEPKTPFVMEYVNIEEHQCEDFAPFMLGHVDFRLKNGWNANPNKEKLGNYNFRLFGCRRFDKEAFLNEGRTMQKDMRFTDAFAGAVSHCYKMLQIPVDLCLEQTPTPLPEYVLTAEITDYFMNICDGYNWNNAAKTDLRGGSSEMTVKWKLMNLTQTQVVWEGTTTGYGDLEQGEENGEVILIERAFADAASNLQIAEGFERQLASRVSAEEIAKYREELIAKEREENPAKCMYKEQIEEKTCPACNCPVAEEIVPEEVIEECPCAGDPTQLYCPCAIPTEIIDEEIPVIEICPCQGDPLQPYCPCAVVVEPEPVVQEVIEIVPIVEEVVEPEPEVEVIETEVIEPICSCQKDAQISEDGGVIESSTDAICACAPAEPEPVVEPACPCEPQISEDGGIIEGSAGTSCACALTVEPEPEPVIEPEPEPVVEPACPCQPQISEDGGVIEGSAGTSCACALTVEPEPEPEPVVEEVVEPEPIADEPAVCPLPKAEEVVEVDDIWVDISDVKDYENLCIVDRPPYEDLTPENLYKVRASVLSITNSKGRRGAGLLVSDSFVLTSADLIDGRDNVYKLKTINGKDLTGRAFRVNPSKNVALIMLDEPTLYTPLSLNLDLPQIGKGDFMVLGMLDVDDFSDGENYLDNNGVIDGYRYTDDRGAEIILDTFVQNITIGGALIDKYGTINGIAHSTQKTEDGKDLFIPTETALRGVGLSICEKVYKEPSPWQTTVYKPVTEVVEHPVAKAPEAMPLPDRK